MTGYWPISFLRRGCDQYPSNILSQQGCSITKDLFSEVKKKNFLSLEQPTRETPSGHDTPIVTAGKTTQAPFM